jgi:hypothetical protein
MLLSTAGCDTAAEIFGVAHQDEWRTFHDYHSYRHPRNKPGDIVERSATTTAHMHKARPNDAPK